MGKVDKAYVDGIKDELVKYDMVVLQHEIPLETVHYIAEFCYEKKYSSRTESGTGSRSADGYHRQSYIRDTK